MSVSNSYLNTFQSSKCNSFGGGKVELRDWRYFSQFVPEMCSKLMDCNQKGHFGNADSYLLSAGFSLFPLEVLAVQLLMISTSFGLRWMGTPNAFAIPGCKQFSHCTSIMKSREMICLRSYPQKSSRREWAQHPLMWKRGQTYQWTERLRQQWYQHRLR